MNHFYILYVYVVSTDRDEHINVLYNNIKPFGLSQYDKCTKSYCKTHGTDYDCSSIMHYRYIFYANKYLNFKIILYQRLGFC